MAKFTFSIATDDKEEMASLLAVLLGTAAAIGIPVATETTAAPATTRKPRGSAKAQATATDKEPTEKDPAEELEKDPAEEPESDEGEEDSEEITREMVTQLGSKLMPKLRAAGIKAIIVEHGGGADTFGSIKDDYLPAVYRAFKEADI